VIELRECDSSLRVFNGSRGVCNLSKLHSCKSHCLPAYAPHHSRVSTCIHVPADMDVSSTGIQVESNLVHSTAYAPIEWHINPGVSPAVGAVATRIINNVLVASGTNAFYTAKGGAVLYWDGLSPSVFERNVVVVNHTQAPAVSTLFTGRTCKEDFPTSTAANCTAKYADNFAEAAFAANVWWNTSGVLAATFPGGVACPDDRACASLSDWQARGFDVKSVVVDPRFKNPAAGDFTVTATAALALGIAPLSGLADAGPTWSL
jgi:hypothetical protein